MDADHIAAIDNVTRKLMQEGKRPITVGFFFAMGHSAVMVIAAAGVAATTTLLSTQFGQFKSLGGIISTGVSALFLFVIATANLFIMRSVWRTYRHVRAGGHYVDEDFDILLNCGGVLARLFRPLFRMVTKGWHMTPLGLLFGLGFDTATEVALLGMSATQAAQGVSIWSIMVFPTLLAAGMSLIDTTDGVLMLGAYVLSRHQRVDAGAVTPRLVDRRQQVVLIQVGRRAWLASSQGRAGHDGVLLQEAGAQG